MRFAGSACCAAMVLLGLSAGAVSVRVDGTEQAAVAGGAKEPPAAARARGALPEQRIADGDWADRLRSEDFWQGTRSRPDETSRRALGATPRRFSPIQHGDELRSKGALFASGNYRTVCVRLCDGYFWPLSFAASRAALPNDRRKCQESCESPAKLFLAKDANTPLEDMRDENGRYYRDLKTAFVHRTAYVESCKCRAHPWEPAAQARHAAYARGAKPSLLRR